MLSVGIYVVKTFRGILITRKSCKKQKKTPKIRRFQVFFWSCWADLNRRPHPYQAIFAGFYNNFRLFSVVFIPNNIVSRTFLKRRLRCFHACLWWNCGQATICANDVCTNLISAAQRRTPAIPCDFPSSFRAIFLFACNRYY